MDEKMKEIFRGICCDLNTCAESVMEKSENIDKHGKVVVEEILDGLVESYQKVLNFKRKNSNN